MNQRAFGAILDSLAALPEGWGVTVDEGWAQGRTIFGGLLAALGNEAMRRVVDAARPLRAFQATFIAPVLAGDLHVRARQLRSGRAVSIAQAELVQAGQVAVTMVGIYGSARESSLRVQPTAAAATRDVAQLRDLDFVPGMSPNYLRHFAIRWGAGGLPFSGATSTRIQVFARHRDEGTGSAAQEESRLLALIDAAPSATVTMMRSKAPISSLTWSADFPTRPVAHGAAPWWRLDAEIVAADSGYVSENCSIVCPAGSIVALSRQVVTAYA